MTAFWGSEHKKRQSNKEMESQYSKNNILGRILDRKLAAYRKIYKIFVIPPNLFVVQRSKQTEELTKTAAIVHLSLPHCPLQN